MVCMPLLKAEYIFRDYVYRFYQKDGLCYRKCAGKKYALLCSYYVNLSMPKVVITK